MNQDKLGIRTNLLQLEEAKQQVFRAFAGVRLENGIGFYEAGAIDDRFNPSDVEYLEEKARDERDDWTKVFSMLESLDCFDQNRHCFMDAKGLHFYLPIVLLLSDSVANDSILMRGVIDKRPQNLELMQLLTLEQKKSILNLLVADIDYDASISYFENFKGPICVSCGKIRFPASYTAEEAINEVETSDEFLLLKFLESHLQL